MIYSRFVFKGLSLAASGQLNAGCPVFFQHGLCGDSQQTAEVFPENSTFRRLTLECRGHGSSDVGNLTALSIETFADDVAAFISSAANRPAIVGGISMGAAIALRIAVRRPELVSALILARPAWTVFSAPVAMRAHAFIGELLSKRVAEEARREFDRSEYAQRLALDAPDNLASLHRLFERKPRAVTSALLTAIAADGPQVEWSEVERIAVPVLVIGHDRDIIHPLSYATDLAVRIPGAVLVHVTAKANDRRCYVADFRAALSGFLDVCTAYQS